MPPTIGEVTSTRTVVARPGQIRRLGPLAALLLPASLLIVAGFAFYVYPCDGASCVKPTLLSYLLVLLAAPTSILAGLPWIIHPMSIGIAAFSSLVLWLGLGRWAARRATEDVDATWATFAGELAFMLAGIWGGIVVGLTVVGLWLTH